MTTVTNEEQLVKFYGVLREVIQLMYNSIVQSHRTVVVLRYDWYNLDGTTKSTGIEMAVMTPLFCARRDFSRSTVLYLTPLVLQAA